MQITVELPEDADPAAVQALEEAVEAAGGSWAPAEETPPMQPGMPMPPEMGPAAGMTPGAALTGMGASALRPPGM